MKPSALQKDKKSLKTLTLDKLLSKYKKAVSIPVAIRFTPEDVAALAEIERTTDLPYSALIRMVLRRMLKYWDKKRSLTLPLYISVMSVNEARQKGFIKDGDDGVEPTKDL